MAAGSLGFTAAEVHARAGGENFPVALRLLARAQRRHLTAIYGFARLTDQIGDAADGDRLAQLDELAAQLERALAGGPAHPLVRDLVPTIRALDLPTEPFERLIQANRQDQTVHRYATFEALAGYCALSANPVGWLVLRVFGVATPERIEWSDRVCTGLQLAEHWQDVTEDFAAGRVYLPAEDLRRFGCAETDLAQPTASAALRELMRFETQRARKLLDAGIPLVQSLGGRARLAVCGFVAGGRAALDAVAHCSFDVLAHSPRPRRRDFARRYLGLLLAPRVTAT